MTIKNHQIVAVTNQEIGTCLKFLTKHEDAAQFLINNLKEHGPCLTSHHNSGNFKMICDPSGVRGVFCLSRRGNLLVQSEGDFASLILEACCKEEVSLKGFIGDWLSIEPVVKLHRHQNPSYEPSYESKEILYSYELKSDDLKLQHDPRVRFLEEPDFEQWLMFSKAFMTELSLPDELNDEQKRSDFLNQIKKQVSWGLFDQGTLISRVALNSKGEKVGQVGGVFTPPKHRQKGFAKAAMFHMLRDCRDLHRHTKNILFTGETDIPAQKLYESMSYQRIGSFALVLSQ